MRWCLPAVFVLVLGSALGQAVLAEGLLGTGGDGGQGGCKGRRWFPEVVE